MIHTVVWLVLHWEEYRPRLLNVTGSELVSRARIADEINRITGDRLKYMIVKPFDSLQEQTCDYTDEEPVLR